MIETNCLECLCIFSYYPSQSTGKYCSNICQKRYQFKTDIIPKILIGEISNRKTLRRYLLKELGEFCSHCKSSVWLGKPIPLEIDHIDGDASNNIPKNLRLLCPNCHALMPTSKGRNRGKGRKSRGILIN